MLLKISILHLQSLLVNPFKVCDEMHTEIDIQIIFRNTDLCLFKAIFEQNSDLWHSVVLVER